jgi:hypothetical protein
VIYPATTDKKERHRLTADLEQILGAAEGVLALPDAGINVNEFFLKRVDDYLKDEINRQLDAGERDPQKIAARLREFAVEREITQFRATLEQLAGVNIGPLAPSDRESFTDAIHKLSAFSDRLDDEVPGVKAGV